MPLPYVTSAQAEKIAKEIAGEASIDENKVKQLAKEEVESAPTGTIKDTLGLDNNGDLVKGTINEVPTPTSSDKGKYLGVNNSGEYELRKPIPDTSDANTGDVLELDNLKQPKWKTPKRTLEVVQKLISQVTNDDFNKIIEDPDEGYWYPVGDATWFNKKISTNCFQLYQFSSREIKKINIVECHINKSAGGMSFPISITGSQGAVLVIQNYAFTVAPSLNLTPFDVNHTLIIGFDDISPVPQAGETFTIPDGGSYYDVFLAMASAGRLVDQTNLPILVTNVGTNVFSIMSLTGLMMNISKSGNDLVFTID